MKKLTLILLTLIIVPMVFPQGNKRTSDYPAISTLSPGSLLDVSYNSGALYYSRKMTANQYAAFLADTGLTYTPTTGIGLRLAIAGVKNWHVADATLHIGKFSTATRDSIRKRQPHEDAIYVAFSTTDLPKMDFDTGTLTIPAGRVFLGDGTYSACTAFSGTPHVSTSSSIIYKPDVGIFTIALNTNTDDTLALSNKNVIIGHVDRGYSRFSFRGMYQITKTAITYQSPGLLSGIPFSAFSTLATDSIRKRQPHENAKYFPLSTTDIVIMNFDTNILTIPAGRLIIGDGSYYSSTAYTSSAISGSTYYSIIFKPTAGKFTIASSTTTTDTLNLSNKNVIVGIVHTGYKQFWFGGEYRLVKSLNNYNTLQRDMYETAQWLSLSDSVVTANLTTGSIVCPRGRIWDGSGNYSNTPASTLTVTTTIATAIILDPSESRYLTAQTNAADDSIRLSSDRVIIGTIWAYYKQFWWKGNYRLTYGGNTYSSPSSGGVGLSHQFLAPDYPGSVLEMFSGADSLYISTGWDGTGYRTYLQMYSIDSSTDLQYNTVNIPFYAMKNQADLPTTFLSVQYKTQHADTANNYLQIQVIDTAGASIYLSPQKLANTSWTTQTVATASFTASSIVLHHKYFLRLKYYSKKVTGTGQYVRTGPVIIYWEQ